MLQLPAQDASAQRWQHNNHSNEKASGWHVISIITPSPQHQIIAFELLTVQILPPPKQSTPSNYQVAIIIHCRLAVPSRLCWYCGQFPYIRRGECYCPVTSLVSWMAICIHQSGMGDGNVWCVVGCSCLLVIGKDLLDRRCHRPLGPCFGNADYIHDNINYVNELEAASCTTSSS